MKRALLLAAVVAGCAQRTLDPVGQVVLGIDTDAPVPAAPGTTSPIPPLFDRIRVEVLVDGKPVEEGARDFAIHSGLFADRSVSVGIVPRGTTIAHVSLLRGDRVIDGAPIPGTSLETWVALPEIPAEGIVRAHVDLSVASLGKTMGTPDAPVAAATGPVTDTRVGKWSGATRVPCAKAPSDGEACAEGGAFWFGDPAFRGRSTNDFVEERLVVLSPFLVDRREVTVLDFRKRWPELAAKGIVEPTAWTGARSGAVVEDWCSWVSTETPADPTAMLPLNCVAWPTAEAYCEAEGKKLPTEAQFEYVASGLGRELSHAWGEEDPDCYAAVWARAGVGALSSYPSDCLAPGSVGWMAVGATGSRDVALLGGAKVADLGGNLSEWTRDDWALPSDPFWAKVAVYTDPVAAAGAETEFRPVRGGSWLQPAAATRASFRLRNRPLDRVRGVGFRCVRE